MLHESIDIFALVVAVLGLIPLWREQSRRAFAIGFTVLLVVGAAYILWDYEKDKRENEMARRDQFFLVTSIENDIEKTLCAGDMGFDEIQTHLNYGIGFDDINLAIDALVQGKKSVIIVPTSIDSPTPPKRKVSLRIYKLVERSPCVTH